ncbi:hypothetical protein [Rhodoflexus sp.]
MKRLIAISLCLLGLFARCMPSAQPSQESKQTAYFSIAAAVDQQAAVLNARRAQSLKVVQAGTESPDTLAPQPTDWADELRLFKEADINKPAWIGEYEVSETTGSIRYTAKKASQPVRLLIVKGTAKQPAAIEAHLVQSNLLYHTEKHLYLNFSKGELAAYRIAGFQKTVFSDTTRYLLAATIR